MMLSGKAIVAAYLRGDIIIDDFRPEQVKPNSYDIRLGNWIVRQKTYRFQFDPTGDMVSRIWDDPQCVYDRQYAIAPGEYVLTHSMEVVGSTKYAMLLKGRSTAARIGIDVCPSAGFGDLGFVSKWTLELMNHSQTTIVLKPGMRIGQISFSEVTDSEIQYAGAYSNRDWKPEHMLPVLGDGRF